MERYISPGEFINICCVSHGKQQHRHMIIDTIYLLFTGAVAMVVTGGVIIMLAVKLDKRLTQYDDDDDDHEEDD